MKDRENDEGDQELIAEQREEQEIPSRRPPEEAHREEQGTPKRSRAR